MGTSLRVMRACHDLEARRRFRISVNGREDMTWICSSFGKERKSWSNVKLEAYVSKLQVAPIQFHPYLLRVDSVEKRSES